MRVSKRKTLKVDDLNQSLKFLNFRVRFFFKFFKFLTFFLRVCLDMTHMQMQNMRVLIL